MTERLSLSPNYPEHILGECNEGDALHVVFMLIPMLHGFRRQDHGDILLKLTQIIEAGGLKPIVDDCQFTLEQAGEAHARLESGKAIGKVVIDN